IEVLGRAGNARVVVKGVRAADQIWHAGAVEHLQGVAIYVRCFGRSEQLGSGLRRHSALNCTNRTIRAHARSRCPTARLSGRRAGGGAGYAVFTSGGSLASAGDGSTGAASNGISTTRKGGRLGFVRRRSGMATL